MNHINKTEEVVDNIKVVADEIEEGNKGIESVINSCSDHIDEITNTILSSEKYYD
jgi:methyl-accepting chemotaxis protein